MNDYEKAIVRGINRFLNFVRVSNQEFFVALLKEIYLVTDPELFRPTKENVQ